MKKIKDKWYDLKDFIDTHPGGKMWLIETRGTDITEVFETFHLDIEKATKILPKYYHSDLTEEEIMKYPQKFTFEENGFYKTLKKRVLQKLKSGTNKYK